MGVWWGGVINPPFRLMAFFSYNFIPRLFHIYIFSICFRNESSQINTTGVASNLTLMNLYKLSKLVTLHLNGQNGLSLMPMQPLTNLKCLTHLVRSKILKLFLLISLSVFLTCPDRNITKLSKHFYLRCKCHLGI